MRIGFILIIMLSVNLILMLAQNSINGILDSENIEGSLNWNQDNDRGTLGTVIGSDNITVIEYKGTDLPDSVNNDVSSGGFSDLFNTFKNWLVKTVPGAQLMLDMVNAMPRFLKIFFPSAPEIATLFGAMWNLLTVFLLISWLRWNF